jgi:hypothetical protein
MVDEEAPKPSGGPGGNSSQFSKADLMRLLRKAWADRGYEIAENDRIGVPIHDLVGHSVEHNAELDLPLVDLWVALLDECISWFISLYTVVYTEYAKEVGLTTFEKAILMILSKVIADSIAIRHLVLAGFDTSARTILRSVSEYMEVLVAIIHQPTFANEFVKSDTPESAQIFWEEHLRGGKIRRRVTAAWTDFFMESDRDAAKWFANWGRGASPLLSGLSHPSFAGGLFAAIPLKVHYKEENWLGIWGQKAESSVETIYIYLQFIFPILLLSHEFPFEGPVPQTGNSRTYDETNEFHRHVRLGRGILGSVILSLGKESNVPFVFPDFDMSIWLAEPDPEQSG